MRGRRRRRREQVNNNRNPGMTVRVAVGGLNLHIQQGGADASVLA